MRRRDDKRSWDYLLLLTILLVLFLGVVFVYDASVVRADNIFGGKYHFLILQGIWSLIGLTILWLAARTEYRLWFSLSKPILVLSCSLLILTIAARYSPAFLKPVVEIFAPEIKGSHRWLFLNYKTLPGLPLVGRLGFQPSESAKFALVTYLALLLSKGRRFLADEIRALLAIGFMGFLILLQPDFGSALIVVLTGLAIYFASGVGALRVFLLLVLTGILAFVLIFVSPYRRERLLTYLNLAPTRQEDLGKKYQINQVLIALGSGGLTGRGLGQSRQKYDYIPEVNTDAILGVVGEELGLLGTTLLLSLFLFIIIRGLAIALAAEKGAGLLLAVGLTVSFGVQSFLNFGGMIRLLPLTGVPLPLISYGGSSLIMTLLSLGVLLSVAKYGRSNKG